MSGAEPPVLFAVGDEVHLVRSRRGVTKVPDNSRTGVVTKIARRWATVETPWGDAQFDARTGWENAGQYSPVVRAMTLAMFEDERDRQDAIATLRRHGIEANRDALPTALLVAVAELATTHLEG